MKVFFDSSALVSLLNPESLFYRQAVESWMTCDHRATSCHALAEAYRTLTTLKKPMKPEDARIALHDLTSKIELAPGTAEIYKEAIDRMAAGGHPGAMIYDALHCVAAKKLKADKIVTRNKPHFDLFADGIEVEALT
jgi:predicted nucleic acid-binding protein